MPEPELHVRDYTPPMLAASCDSGEHFAHPGDTCEEINQWQSLIHGYLEQALAKAYAETERAWLFGTVTSDMRGGLSLEPVQEPTPIERALAILDPELRSCPLYNAGPPVLYPASWDSQRPA